jgi:signal transduction histidine kinase
MFVQPALEGPEAGELMERLQRFTAELSVAVTMRDVARVLLEQGLAHFGARAAGIVWMMRPGRLELVFGRGLTEKEYRELDILARAGERLPIRDAILERRSVWLETPEEIRAHYPVLEPLRARRGESGCAVVPLVLGDRCPGVIGFTFDRQAPFSAGERILIEALARLSAEAFERARLFEAEQEARREAERSRGLLERLLAVVGHDLRTPLGAITGAADLVERGGALSPLQAKALQLLRGSAQRMTRMVADVLDYSAARSGLGLGLRAVPADLGQLAERAVQELSAHEGSAAPIALDVAGDLHIEGDVDRLMQLVSNLVGNALQHGAGSPVQVEVQDAGAALHVIVRNGGPSIPPGRLENLFEPFHRGAAEPGAPRNLGLGLYIVREIARAHGGEIHVRSCDDEGTEVRVVLPRRAGASPSCSGPGYGAPSSSR